MKTTVQELVDRLARHRTIGGAPREELLWIAEHGTFRTLQQGEIVSRPAEVVDGLHIVLSGRMSIYGQRGPGVRKMMEWVGGDVTGLLPYSRMTTPPGTTIVEDPSDTITITREELPELIRHCHEVTSILVHVMTDRARRFTSSDLRDEKMISLGKLAAGFAHEVNNPASAALRDAKSLAGILGSAEEAARELFASGLTGAQLAEIEALCNTCRTAPAHLTFSGLEIADREDAFAEWLRRHDMAEDLAPELARTPVTTSNLDGLARIISGLPLRAALRWAAFAFLARSLVADIERATTRIHSLVSAAKGFTHMDRSPDLGPVEISGGLSDAIALLGGKARKKSIAIELQVPRDLPPIWGYAVEINQIWMNLVDNAIDAVSEHGHIAVTAILEGADVIVSVVDDGPGIPPDIREIIFDPFFTTKAVGEGTGLGLDIVRRVVHWHNGDIAVDSRPGRTEFKVTLPVGGAR